MELKAKLNRPYFYNGDSAFHIKQALLFGAFVILFLEVFKPFGIEGVGEGLHLIILGFGVLTAITMIMLNVLIPRLGFRFFTEEDWTVKRELIYSFINVSLIGLFNFIYFSVVISHEFSFSALLWFQFSTWAVGLMPLVLMTFIKEKRLSAQYENEANEINKQLKKKQPHHKRISLVSNNQNEADIEMDIDDLLFVKSAANYLEVHSFNEKHQRSLIRKTLKEVEAELSSHTQLYRCHKSYVVNLSQVEKLTGNSQGYRLQIKNTDLWVPVSRSLHEEVKNRLTIRP